MSVTGGNNINVVSVYFEDFPAVDTLGSAICVQNSNSLVLIKESKFNRCSSTLNGGAVYSNSKNNTQASNQFTSCKTVERGGCCYLDSPIINVSEISVLFSSCDVQRGSLYLKNGLLDARNFNDSQSYGKVCAGFYPISSKANSVAKFIASHKVEGEACSGWSTDSSNILFTKYVLTDCPTCDYVFLIYGSDFEIEEIFLWNVPNKLRESGITSPKLVINNLFSNIVFGDKDNNINKISAQHQIAEIPDIKIKFFDKNNCSQLLFGLTKQYTLLILLLLDSNID